MTHRKRRRGGGVEYILRETACPCCAREQQVLIKRRFERSRISRAQHRSRFFNVIRQAHSRRSAGRLRQPVIRVASQADVQQKAAQRDLVLNIGRILVNVMAGLKVE